MLLKLFILLLTTGSAGGAFPVGLILKGGMLGGRMGGTGMGGFGGLGGRLMTGAARGGSSFGRGLLEDLLTSQPEESQDYESFRQREHEQISHFREQLSALGKRELAQSEKETAFQGRESALVERERAVSERERIVEEAENGAIDAENALKQWADEVEAFMANGCGYPGEQPQAGNID